MNKDRWECLKCGEIMPIEIKELHSCRGKKGGAEMENKEIVAQGIVMPAVSPDEALKAWKGYEDLKAKVATANDKQEIQGKTFLKKSYWRKIARFFNLSVEGLNEKRIEGKEGDFSYLITYRATAKNGSYADGDGACSSNEKGLLKTEHNTRSTAHTRAFNRAVSNLIGGGEVSADEIVVNGGYHKSVQKPQADSSETKMQDEIGDRILEMCSQEVELARGMLEEMTKFYAKDNKLIPGVRSVRDLRGARLNVISHKCADMFSHFLSQKNV